MAHGLQRESLSCHSEGALATEESAFQRLHWIGLVHRLVSRRKVAVGTAVTGRPPHRSVRECCLIRLLPRFGREMLRAHPPGRKIVFVRLKVRARSVCWMFILAESLSSTDSAAGLVPALFVCVDGTTDSSDFRLAFMATLPAGRFAARAGAVPLPPGNQPALPVLAIEISTHAQVLTTPPCPVCSRH